MKAKHTTHPTAATRPARQTLAGKLIRRPSSGLLAACAATALLLAPTAPAEASWWRVLRRPAAAKPTPPRPPQPTPPVASSSRAASSTTGRAAASAPPAPVPTGKAAGAPQLRNPKAVSRAEIRTPPQKAIPTPKATPPSPPVKPSAPKPAPQLAPSIPRAAPSGSITVEKQAIAPQPASARLLYGSHKSGPYGALQDHHSVGLGKAFTDHQKRQVRQTNMLRNNLQLRDDHTGIPLQQGKQHRAGVRPPDNEAHIDHVVPKSKGGSNSHSNAEVRSRADNLAKGDKTQ